MNKEETFQRIYDHIMMSASFSDSPDGVRILQNIKTSTKYADARNWFTLYKRLASYYKAMNRRLEIDIENTVREQIEEELERRFKKDEKKKEQRYVSSMDLMLEQKYVNALEYLLLKYV